MGNTAQQCRLGIFQDSDFAGDPEDSKINIIFGSYTFVPISWMCKTQTSVSHSSTEAEIISLDAGLRIGGMPALDLWDLVTEVFHSSPNRLKKSKGEEYRETRRVKPHQTSTPKTKPRFQPQHDNFDLNNVYHFGLSHFHPRQCEDLESTPQWWLTRWERPLRGHGETVVANGRGSGATVLSMT